MLVARETVASPPSFIFQPWPQSKSTPRQKTAALGCFYGSGSLGVTSPAPHRLPHFRRGLIAHCRAEVDEALAPSILRPSWTKRISEKIKFLMRIRTAPVVILAIDDFRLVRMQLQFATL